jgi:hypothetical protein
MRASEVEVQTSRAHRSDPGRSFYMHCSSVDEDDRSQDEFESNRVFSTNKRNNFYVLHIPNFNYVESPCQDLTSLFSCYRPKTSIEVDHRMVLALVEERPRYGVGPF